MTMNAQVNQSLSDTITVNEVEVTAKYVAPVSVSGMTIPVRQVPQSVSVRS